MAEVLERCAQARGNGAVAQKKVELTCLGLGPPENSQFAIEHDPFRSLIYSYLVKMVIYPLNMVIYLVTICENGDFPV